MELLDYVRKYHPFSNKNIKTEFWQQHIKYHFRMIVRCIYYLHIHCNIAHLDISLENFVIDKNIIRIIDFGLAKCDKEKLKKKWKCEKIVGKTLYQAPEMRQIRKHLQINNSEKKTNTNNNNNNNNNDNNDNIGYYNPFECDVWALGVMLFIMLVGAQPWTVAENTQETFNVIMNGQIVKLLQAWKSVEYVEKDALGMYSTTLPAQCTHFG